LSRSPGRYLRDADAHLYGAPVNRFVAGFIGTPAMNFLEGRREEEDGVPVFIAEGARMIRRLGKRNERWGEEPSGSSPHRSF
jgi:ABC-type sugar transport system ATPase subunit